MLSPIDVPQIESMQHEHVGTVDHLMLFEVVELRIGDDPSRAKETANRNAGAVQTTFRVT